ncbi:MAG: hypothetical protein ABW278_12850 [Steroidobacteraceae bacterium]
MTVAIPAARDRAFFTGMAVVAALVVFIGFAPSFFLTVANPQARPLEPIYHFHGAMFSAWMAFFIVQNLLIARGNRVLHVKLGIFGGLLGCAMIVMAFWVTLHATRSGFGGPLGALPDRIQAMAVPFLDMFVFAPLFLAGLYYRRRSPDAHKRLMLMATVGGLLGAAIGRAPLFVGELDRQLYLYLALVLAGPLHDLITRRRIHPAYLFALLPCLFFLTSMRLRIGASAWWHAFATSIL